MTFATRRAIAQRCRVAQPLTPPQPDALALTGAQLARLGAELRACSVLLRRDDVAACHGPDGTPSRAQRIGTSASATSFSSASVSSERLLSPRTKSVPMNNGKVRGRQPVAKEGAAEAKEVCLS